MPVRGYHAGSGAAHETESPQLQPHVQIQRSAATAAASMTQDRVTNAVPVAATQAPRPIAKPIARANTSPSVVKHPSENAATPIRVPVTATQPQQPQENPPSRPSTETVAEPQTVAVQSMPNSKRPTMTAAEGPTRRGQGNTCVTRGELCALAALAQIFPGKTFEKVRPEWLINDRTKRRLEIDLFNHELRLGLEHSGQSHYVFPNSLHKTREEFDAQVYRDKLKQELCAGAGVLLIHVPFTVPHASMETYIRGELTRLTERDSSNTSVDD